MLKKALFIVSLGTLVAVLLVPIHPCVPAHAEEPEAECWAVIIGVSDYPFYEHEYLYVTYVDEEGNLLCSEDLEYPDDDSREFAQQLGSIWGEDHIKLLLNSEATRVDIYYAIKWLADKADADDTVLLYFSGHGLEPNRIGEVPYRQYSQKSGSGYLCPFGIRRIHCDYHISALDLARWLNKLDSEEVVIILDTCYAGSFGKELSQENRVVLMSCQSDEGALESCELEHGVFTYYILQAFSNFDAADTNHDYELSAEEVFNYAEPRTIDENITCDGITVSEGDKQHPVLSDGSCGELSLLMEVIFHTDAHFPPDTAILAVDNKPYLSRELPPSFTWAAGSVHDFGIPSQVDTGERKRLVFTSWNDGDTSVSRTISQGGEYAANYKTQYQLTVESAYGDPVGEGWYDSGSTATISVTYPEGTLIRKVFTGWSRDFTGTTAAASVTMDMPKTVTANWRTDYSRLYILIAGIMALVGAAGAAMTYTRRRKKSS